MAAYGIGRPLYIIFPLAFFLLLSFLFSSPNFSGRRVDVTWCGLIANLECRSEMCCTWLAGSTGRKTDAKNRHIGSIAQICSAVSSQIRHISTIGKNLLSSKTSSICPDNMTNFGPLTAEIGSGVWGTPANFNRFCVFGIVTAQHSSSGRQPNFAALNRGRHLYSAGRPSRWASAHILVRGYDGWLIWVHISGRSLRTRIRRP